MRPIRLGVTLIELLVVVAVTAALFSLFLPAVQKVRAAAARIGCSNHLRQVALGLHLSHDTDARLPPGVSLRGNQYKYMGWCARLLPHLDQDAVWQEAVAAYAKHPSFRHAAHATPRGQVVRVFTCPSDDRIRGTVRLDEFPVAFTSFLGVAGTDLYTRDGVLYADSGTRLTDVVDGTSQTLMVGERPPSADFLFGWWYAGMGQTGEGSADLVLGARERNVFYPGKPPPGPYRFGPGTTRDDAHTFHFWSLHPGGANFALCDGSVRFLPYSADAILPALATRAGGETVALD